MKNKIRSFSIFSILFIGIYGAGGLVIKEFTTGQGCPKIMHIPMCVIILICLLIPFLAQLFKKWNRLYFLASGFAASIALIASVMQFLEQVECPKTTLGTPMCYYSLALFSSVILLKIIAIKQKPISKS